ncbi:MAG TPA: SRPBCC domain-containing protein [Terracidiphilus sp.]|nr:SRPBCC domain-containing protein [Terracidiphilus sp.]
MNLAPAREDTIVHQVEIHAPAARIFAAISSPEELLRWWTKPGKFATTHAECDLRPGGAWRMRLEGGCDTSRSCTIVYGIYRQVAPPHRLSYTWIREGEDYPESLVTWDLEEFGGITTVRVTHSGLISEAMRTRNSGWPMILDLLATWTTQL